MLGFISESLFQNKLTGQSFKRGLTKEGLLEDVFSLKNFFL